MQITPKLTQNSYTNGLDVDVFNDREKKCMYLCRLNNNTLKGG